MKVLAALALFVSVPSVAAIPQPDTISGQITLAWAWACEQTRAKCANYARPTVAFTPEMPFNMNGIYFAGEDVVYLNLMLAGTRAALFTMTHEMTHFIQGQQGRLRRDTTHDEDCALEKQARDVATALADAVNAAPEDRSLPWSEAARLYGCTP